jgi:amino acid transporter
MQKPAPVTTKKFGTFLGVFLPSILTVLGLIMYLRIGWVVGNLGLGLTIVIIVVSSVITLITGLSASAIATNIKVGVGGVYYLVSRSLGLETGGAIGIAFYISRTLSITLYCFGLAETILLFWPEAWGIMPGYATPVFTAVLIVIITLMAGKSAEMVLKLQIPMLMLVSLSILALIAGVLMGDLQAPEWGPTYRTEPGGFWIVFAVFFPGMTGFLAGIGMSGDLKRPEVSIPRGTISSTITGGIVYLIVSIFLSVTTLISYDQMADPKFGLQTWTQVAFLGGLFIYPAAWGAIFSSAIDSALSCPRVLQSLSMDGLAPKFLSKLSRTGQPTTATWVTGGIALAAVALGDLNTVAKFVTVLFLTLYVVINLMVAIEKLVAEPSYRPKIDIPWYISMAGAVSTLLVMYFISPVALLLALGLETAFYIYFRKRALEQQWGDVLAGFWMRIARFALLRINRRLLSPRNWRPLIIVFVKDVNERIELVNLAAAFGQNRGILTVCKLTFADDHLSLEKQKELQKQMMHDLKSHHLEAFCEVDVVQSLHNGILNISKGHGIAGLKTNTVMFGWSGDRAGNAQQLRIIRDLSVAGKNILLVKFNDHESWKEKTHRRIDIWWGGRENNGDLMLILAYMLKLTPEWENARIHIHAVVNNLMEQDLLSKGIRASLAEARIYASVHTVLKNEDGFTSILHRESTGADIVFLGLKVTKTGEEEKHAAKLEQMAGVAKVVVFVQNNSIRETLPLLLSGYAYEKE